MIHVGRRIGWIGIVIHESQSYSTHICMVFDQNRPNVVNMIRYIMRGWYEVCFCVYIYIYTNIFLILCTYTLCDFSLEQQIVTLILGRLPSLIRTPFAVSSSNSTAFAKFPGSSRIFQQFQHGFRTKKAGPFFGGAKKSAKPFDSAKLLDSNGPGLLANSIPWVWRPGWCDVFCVNHSPPIPLKEFFPWNLNLFFRPPVTRRFLLETSILSFHLKFRGCKKGKTSGYKGKGVCFGRRGRQWWQVFGLKKTRLITCSDRHWPEKTGLILLISHVIVVCKRVGTDGKLPFLVS